MPFVFLGTGKHRDIKYFCYFYPENSRTGRSGRPRPGNYDVFHEENSIHHHSLWSRGQRRRGGSLPHAGRTIETLLRRGSAYHNDQGFPRPRQRLSRRGQHRQRRHGPPVQTRPYRRRAPRRLPQTMQDGPPHPPATGKIGPAAPDLLAAPRMDHEPRSRKTVLRIAGGPHAPDAGVHRTAQGRIRGFPVHEFLLQPAGAGLHDRPRKDDPHSAGTPR